MRVLVIEDEKKTASFIRKLAGCWDISSGKGYPKISEG